MPQEKTQIKAVLKDSFNYVFYYPNLSTETHAVIVFHSIIEV